MEFHCKVGMATAAAVYSLEIGKPLEHHCFCAFNKKQD